MNLSESQRNSAQRIDQDVCVVAGPGSGKTRVLIERFHWLVSERGIEPNRILAITFTEKAATEIKKRLVGRFEDDATMREQIERAYVSTIHGFCTRLLRENALAAGIDPLFQILERSRPLLRAVSDEVLETMYAESPQEFRTFLRSIAVSTSEDGFVPDLANGLIDIYVAMRTAGQDVQQYTPQLALIPDPYPAMVSRCHEILNEKIFRFTSNQEETHGLLNEWCRKFLKVKRGSPDLYELLVEEFDLRYLKRGSAANAAEKELRDLRRQLLSQMLDKGYAVQRELVLVALRRIDESYRARKRAQSYLDFSDLEEQAIALLTKDETLRERIRTSFDFILMDELQDTNPLQWQLMNLLRRPDRFFAVGDVNQSIFAFRHAEPQQFHDYRLKLEAAGREIDQLVENYRSREAVLHAVNHVFSGPPDGVSQHELIARRTLPDKQEPCIEAIVAEGDTTEDGEDIEYRAVVRRISEIAGGLIVGEGDSRHPATYADVAVLARTSGVLTEIQAILDEAGIPCVVSGGRAFYDRREVRDLRLLLQVIANPYDEMALAGVLRSPLVGLSDEALLRMKLAGPLSPLPTNGTSPLSVDEIERVRVFDGLLAHCREWRDRISPDRLLRRVIDLCDYEGTLDEQQRNNIAKFLGVIARAWKEGPPSIRAVLGYLESADAESDAPPDEVGNAVRLMTIHASKGLEFPIVFLPGLHKMPANTLPVIDFHREHGLGIKWRVPNTASICGDVAFEELRIRRKRVEDQEGNRLLYVAMTRAEEHLVLSLTRPKGPSSEWRDLLNAQLGLTSLPPGTNEVRDSLRITVLNHAPELISNSYFDAGRREELVAIRPAGLQHESTSSATSLALFVSCPRKYYLGRYLRQNVLDVTLPSELGEDDESPLDELLDEPDITAAELGTQVHKLLAGESIENATAEAHELAARFRSSSLSAAAESASRIEREYPFIIEIEDVIFRGAIDLWYEDSAGIHIVDYKTDKHVNESKVHAYARQMRLYALVLGDITGKPVASAHLYFLRKELSASISVSPEDLEVLRQEIREFRDSHDELDFPVRPGEQCKRCEFYAATCPVGTETFVVAEEDAAVPF